MYHSILKRLDRLTYDEAEVAVGNFRRLIEYYESEANKLYETISHLELMFDEKIAECDRIYDEIFDKHYDLDDVSLFGADYDLLQHYEREMDEQIKRREKLYSKKQKLMDSYQQRLKDTEDDIELLRKTTAILIHYFNIGDANDGEDDDSFYYKERCRKIESIWPTDGGPLY